MPPATTTDDVGTEAPEGTDYLRPTPPPRGAAVTIIAQDPSVKDRTTNRVLTSQVCVPADKMEAGPRTHRFHVVDYDASTTHAEGPADLTDGHGNFVDRFGKNGKLNDDKLIDDPAFRAQNVYAIAARVLAIFERYLGRRLPWSFDSHHLFLVPSVMAEANAYYAQEHHAVFFGYITREDGEVVHTSLSHDIVAHEVTHAILDGLRPHYVQPGLPDQLAFHEAFADLVALLSVFSLPEVLDQQLGEADKAGRIAPGMVSQPTLKGGVLFGVAEQFGKVLTRGSALRRSVGLNPDPAALSQPEFSEPHRRGEILVAAVMDTLATIWTGRLEALKHGSARIDRERVIEEGQKSAEHLLGMLIRGIDYTPPVELEFADYLEAVLCADEILAPDDEHGYRESLKKCFADFGITPSQGIVDYAARDTPWPDYRDINVEALRRDPDEVYRFIWNNAKMLNIDPHILDIDLKFDLFVNRVRHAVRSGPDGLVVTELVAEYTQTLSTTASKLGVLDIKAPPDVDPDTQVQLWGGGTLIFDQFAKLRFHQRKGLAWDATDRDRQQRRLAYLTEQGIRDQRNRLGFSDGVPLGQRFNLLHLTNTDATESW